MKFSMELARSCCRPKPCPSLRSILRSYIDLWVKYDIWIKQHVPNRILCKAVWGKGVCSDSNQTAQLLQMAARKSLETMSGVILSRSQPKFATQSVGNEMRPVTVLGKGCLLRFKSNSTATSDGGAQMLGIDVWYDSGSIAAAWQ